MKIFGRHKQYIMAEPGTNPIEEPVSIAKRKKDPFWIILGTIFVLGLCGSVGWGVMQQQKPKPTPVATTTKTRTPTARITDTISTTSKPSASPTPAPTQKPEIVEVTRLVDHSIIQTVVQPFPVQVIATVLVVKEVVVTVLVMAPTQTVTSMITLSPTMAYIPTITSTPTASPTHDPNLAVVAYFPIISK